MATLRLDTAAFMSILFEVFFFGFYTFLFIIAVRLYFDHSSSVSRVSWHLAVPCLLLYLLAAAHLSTTIKHGGVAYIEIASQGVVDGTIKYLRVTVNATNITNHCLYVLSNLLGDGILIWRCWLVWGRSWRVVAAPLVLLCTSVVAGCMVAYNFAVSTDGPFSNRLGIVANVFFTSIFLTNLIVTSLTAFKIWKCRKLAVSAGSSRDYTGAFNIVVESGAVYSCILMLETLLYAIGENFVFVLYTSMGQITGIAPTSIIVLVLLGRALRHSDRSTSMTLPTVRSRSNQHSTPSRISFRIPRSSRRTMSNNSLSDLGLPEVPAQHIKIDVQRMTDVDTELESVHTRRPRATHEDSSRSSISKAPLDEDDDRQKT